MAYEDFLQEAALEFWLLTQRQPGQSLGWYLQGCKFHLRNLQRGGRSVDSPKRCLGAPCGSTHDSNGDDTPGEGTGLDGLESELSTFDEVSAHDIYLQISRRLSALQQKILQLLIDGFTARVIAQHLALSHTAVNNHRQKIAVLAVQLGLSDGHTTSHSRRPENK